MPCYCSGRAIGIFLQSIWCFPPTHNFRQNRFLVRLKRCFLPEFLSATSWAEGEILILEVEHLVWAPFQSLESRLASGCHTLPGPAKKNCLIWDSEWRYLFREKDALGWFEFWSSIFPLILSFSQHGSTDWTLNLLHASFMEKLIQNYHGLIHWWLFLLWVFPELSTNYLIVHQSCKTTLLNG